MFACMWVTVGTLRHSKIACCCRLTSCVCVFRWEGRGGSCVSHTWCVTFEAASGKHKTVQYQVSTETSHVTDFKPPTALYVWHRHTNRKKRKHIHACWNITTDINIIHSHPNMFTPTQISSLSAVTQQWLPLRGSTITLPYPHVTPPCSIGASRLWPRLAWPCAICQKPKRCLTYQEMRLIISGGFLFPVLDSPAGEGHHGAIKPPGAAVKGVQYIDESAGFSLPVSVSSDKATSSLGMCFSTSLMKSAALALSDFDSFCYLFAFVKAKLCMVTLGVSFPQCK